MFVSGSDCYWLQINFMLRLSVSICARASTIINFVHLYDIHLNWISTYLKAIVVDDLWSGFYGGLKLPSGISRRRNLNLNSLAVNDLQTSHATTSTTAVFKIGPALPNSGGLACKTALRSRTGGWSRCR